MPRVRAEHIAELITHELNRWSTEIEEEIRSLGERIATEGKTMLQIAAQPEPTSSGSGENYKPSARRIWKNYARNWSVQDRSGKNYSSFFIHNKKQYRLTHLLEKGHATRNGGRTRAFEHIAPVDEWCRTEYEKKVEEILGGKK